MSYIRAKYDSLYRPFMKHERQGFGSLYGGNQTSIINQIASRLSDGFITRSVASQMFVSATINDVTNASVQRILNYSNTSLWLESASNIVLNTLNNERTLYNEIVSSGSGNVSTIVSNILERIIESSGLNEYEDLKADMVARASYFEGENCLDDYMEYLGFVVSMASIPATIETSIEERLLSFINESDELFSSQQNPSTIVSTIIDRIMSFTNESLWVISQSNVDLTNVDTLNTLVNVLDGLFNQGQGNHSSVNNNTSSTFNNTHDGLWAVAQNVSILLQNIIERLIQALHDSEWTNTQYTEVQELINEMSSRATYFESQECVEEVLTYLEFQASKSEINNI